MWPQGMIVGCLVRGRKNPHRDKLRAAERRAIDMLEMQIIDVEVGLEMLPTRFRKPRDLGGIVHRILRLIA
jgi:hypothetical protein